MPYIQSSLETKYREGATLPPPRSDDLRAPDPDDYSDHCATRQ